MNKIELGVQIGSKVELCCYCPMLPLGKSGPEKELFVFYFYIERNLVQIKKLLFLAPIYQAKGFVETIYIAISNDCKKMIVLFTYMTPFAMDFDTNNFIR